MAENHLQVPGTPSPLPRDNPGRPRSGSNRSQHSQLSQPNIPAASDNSDFAYGPSIRIRRLSSQGQIAQVVAQSNPTTQIVTDGHHVGVVGRNRSISAPQQTHSGALFTPGLNTHNSYMPDLEEEVISPTSGATSHGALPVPQTIPEDASVQEERPTSSWRPLRRMKTNVSAKTPRELLEEQRRNEYESNLVDFLDIVGKYNAAN
jgi:hypothetical protein